MLGRKSRPVIGNLITGSGNWAGLMDTAASPKSVLEFKIHSPRGLKTYDAGKVGLGIVAALENSDNGGLKIQSQKALYSRNLTRSDPIPVQSVRHRGGIEEMEMDSLEDYTVVTCHKPNKKSITRVYCDGGEYGRNGFDGRGSKNSRVCVFDISPARFGDTTAYPTSDFLSSCHLCQKKLHGKDIYMYRGEKAFCSTECRYRQIAMDERKEKCSSEVSRSAADVSNSPYSNGQIFSTGIFAV